MRLMELTDPLMSLPIKAVWETDCYISTCDGIDHVSWGDSEIEARENFATTLREAKQMNTTAAFESFFTDAVILEQVTSSLAA